MKSPFASLPVPSPDPIFSIAQKAVEAGKEAINCTFGVLMDEDGTVSLYPSVRKAISDTAVSMPGLRYSYPPLLGLPEFRRTVQKLLFTETPPFAVASMATTGGTGALAVNLRLMHQLLRSKRMILPIPAWANHRPPAEAANLEIVDVPYLEGGIPTIEHLYPAVQGEQGDIGLLLQVGSHNPTGLDLSDDDWTRLIQLLKTKECVVLLDCAYQGLKDDPETDVTVIRRFIDAGIPTLVTWSAAKNHAIYALRTGLACAILPDTSLLSLVETHYSRITRQLHSASATVGQMVVVRTQEAYAAEWRADLVRARANIQQKRAKLTSLLPERFQPSLAGFGMFAMLPLSEKQIQVLMNQHKVFMTFDGRINIAGIPDARMEEFAEKIAAVCP